MTKNFLVLCVFGVGFIVNPNLACSGSEGDDEFTYTEQDMKTAALGDWQGSALIDGETVPFTLKLEQASDKSKTQSISAPLIAPQCAQRSFVKPAAACASLSQMPLVGSIESDSELLNGVVTGNVMAGLNLESFQLDIELPSEDRLTGSVQDQAVTEGGIYGMGQLGTFTLQRP